MSAAHPGVVCGAACPQAGRPRRPDDRAPNRLNDARLRVGVAATCAATGPRVAVVEGYVRARRRGTGVELTCARPGADHRVGRAMWVATAGSVRAVGLRTAGGRGELARALARVCSKDSDGLVVARPSEVAGPVREVVGIVEQIAAAGDVL